MILNITHAGRSADYSVGLDDDNGEGHTDDELLRIAEEILQQPQGALSNFVVDRLPWSHPARAWVRPKVPFGGNGGKA